MIKLIFAIAIFYSPLVFSENISKCKQGWKETENNNYEIAVSLFHECIKTGNLSVNTVSRTYRNIGIALKRAKKYKKSIESYDKALSLNPPDPWFDYVNRGNSWSMLGDYSKALEEYKLALKSKPNFNEAYYNKGIVYEKMNEKDKAIIEFEKAYEYGLRTELLFERFVAYGLISKPNE